MTTPDTAAEARNLSDEQCEQLAEWLVRSNGEGCDLLDCFAVELEAGLDCVLDQAPDVLTPADRQLVGRLVSLARVTVHLPALDPLPHQG